MIRNKPIGGYNGLTVILSNPSRFDRASLLSSTGGQLFTDFLKPISRYQCDIRVKEDKTTLLPGTKCVLLLGEPAMHFWYPKTKENTLNELRGTPIDNSPPAIASYFPQDCADIKNYEAEFNKQVEISEDFSYVDDDEGDEKKRHGRTKRKNFGFWLSRDIQKCKLLLKHGYIPKPPDVDYIIYPTSQGIIQDLTSTKNKCFYIDIETDMELNILCFAYSFDLPNIVVVPVLNHEYKWAYSNLHHILRALAIAIRDNCTVAHNGSKFDFYVLANKYRIPLGKNSYDTLLAHHRCWPDIEKSLGHAASNLTWLPYHKDEGGDGYNTTEQCKKLWQYCGKDVYAMILIKQALDLYARGIPGLEQSIKQANDSIRPYLITTLQGIKYRQEEIDSIWNINDRWMTQYLRMLDILIGKEALKKIRGSGKSAMPTSNKQCCEYFHNMLGYPIVARGKEKQDGSRNPSLGKNAIFKLKMKHENPVLDIVIAYRETQKESSSLKFTPWKV